MDIHVPIFLNILNKYKWTFIKKGYDPIKLQLNAGLTVNPFTVGNNAFHFACTPTGNSFKFSTL